MPGTTDAMWECMKTVNVTLSSYNMGDATEADFDSWVAYVCDRIDEACGFEVGVDSARFGSSGDDRISGATDEQANVIREALSSLWDSWCADGAPVVTS